MKKIIIIAVAALVLVVLIVAGLFVFVFNKKEPEKKPVVYEEFALEDMYTNVMNSNRILKIKVVIQYTDVKLKDKLEKEFKSKIVNDIQEYLRSRTYEQMSSVNGQKRLREDILDNVRTDTETTADQISDVFFTDFIIQ